MVSISKKTKIQSQSKHSLSLTRKPLLSALLVASVALTACSSPESDEQIKATEDMTQNTADADKDTVTGDLTVSTAQGDVKIPVNPSPIAVYDMTIMQDLYALGISMDGAPDKLLLDNLKVEGSTPKNIGTVFEPDLEALNAIAPQAVFIGVRMSEKYNELTQVAPTLDLSLDQSNMYDSSKDLLAKLGQIFNKSDKANELQEDIDNAIAEAKKATKGKGNGLVILVNGNKISAQGADSRFSFVHKQFGVPMADESIEDARHGKPVSFEYIKEVNPDWLFVLDRTSAIGTEGVGAKQVLDNELVHQTTAWKNNQIVYLSPDSYLAYGGYYQWITDANNITKAFSK